MLLALSVSLANVGVALVATLCGTTREIAPAVELTVILVPLMVPAVGIAPVDPINICPSVSALVERAPPALFITAPSLANDESVVVPESVTPPPIVCPVDELVITKLPLIPVSVIVYVRDAVGVIALIVVVFADPRVS